MKPMNMLLGTMASLSLMMSAGIAHAAAAGDAQILGVISTANNAEIDAGKVAVDRGQRADVQEFARKMVVDHTASNVKMDAVELKAGFTRAESDESAALKKATDDALANLKNVAAAGFDRMFIDGQVNMHQALLLNLDQNLIPAAQNADVKAFLTDTRAAVESHWNEAKAIQAALPPM